MKYSQILDQLSPESRKTVEAHVGSIIQSRTRAQNELKQLQGSQPPKRRINFNSQLSVTEVVKTKVGDRNVPIFDLLSSSQYSQVARFIQPLLSEAVKAVLGVDIGKQYPKFEKNFDPDKNRDVNVPVKQVDANGREVTVMLPSSLENMSEFYKTILSDPRISESLKVISERILEIGAEKPELERSKLWHNIISSATKVTEENNHSSEISSP